LNVCKHCDGRRDGKKFVIDCFVCGFESDGCCEEEEEEVAMGLRPFL